MIFTCNCWPCHACNWQHATTTTRHTRICNAIAAVNIIAVASQSMTHATNYHDNNYHRNYNNNTMQRTHCAWLVAFVTLDASTDLTILNTVTCWLTAIGLRRPVNIPTNGCVEYLPHSIGHLPGGCVMLVVPAANVDALWNAPLQSQCMHDITASLLQRSARGFEFGHCLLPLQVSTPSRLIHQLHLCMCVHVGKIYLTTCNCVPLSNPLRALKSRAACTLSCSTT